MRIEEFGAAMLINGDCREVMAAMPENSVDAVICDPPYGLSFMGKGWDHGAPGTEFWIEALRVAKPGAHLLAFGGTRTHHHLMVAIEDAGWEIRDTVMWVYGSGFPKSLDVSKAIDKAAGAEREVVGHYKPPEMDKPWNLHNATDERTVPLSASTRNNLDITAPATGAAKQWQGWGTALKPAWEPIILARKPLTGTVAENVQQWGTGALNIDASRVAIDSSIDDSRLGGKGNWSSDKMAKNVYEGGYAGERIGSLPLGRWPANLVHDGSDEVLACFPESKGQIADASNNMGARKTQNVYGAMRRGTHEPSVDSDNEGEVGFKMKPGARRLDTGSAARFFYCAKASKADRDEGCDGLPLREGGQRSETSGQHITRRDGGDPKPVANNHPTVKPTALMRYLCRFVTPPGGTVFDPFMGSGSTGKAALIEGFKFVGIDNDTEHGYFNIACARIKSAKGES